jgi:hypothetical protein
MCPSFSIKKRKSKLRRERERERERESEIKELAQGNIARKA